MVDSVKKISNYFTKKSMKRRRFLTAVIVTAILVLISYVFLYPLLRMISYSFMSVSDLTNPTVNWIPTSLTFENFQSALSIMDYIPTFIQTLIVALLPSIFQVASTAIVGYGLAMYEFRGKMLIFGLILASFIIIPQVTTMPQFLLFDALGINGTILALILPAIFGQGLKSAIFIIIFYSFFSMIPNTIIEAAKMDGANHFSIFYKIGLPSAAPAILISFLFSFIWYWNDTYTIQMFTDYTTLPMQLDTFAATFQKMMQTSGAAAEGDGVTANESVQMAGTLLSIIPLLILYAFTQKRFVNSADTVGITGE